MKEWIVRLAGEIAPSGSEGRIASVLLDAVQDLADETHMDALGNAIATKHGDGPHVMIAAHMDEPGVMVIDIDDNGYLRVIPTGGLTASETAFRQVTFTNGTIGLVCLEDGEKRPEQFDQLYIDIGAKHRQEAESRAFIGLSGVIGGSVTEVGNGRLLGRALDNRVGCAIALQAFRDLAQRGLHVSVVFTAQNAPGARAAQAAAFALEPDLAIVVDATPASDVPGGKRTALQLGAGPAFKVMDAGTVAPLAVKQLVEDTAHALGITLQYEVWPSGRSDTGAIQLTRAGILAAGISYPVHTAGAAEAMVDLADVEATLRLLVASVQAYRK
ncbi:aminopeptidase [Alicyclobacillus hesperidum]|uniref:Aminopeptidase n=1 Tax=Alicyclobacillus hesperidum TaxID=89784 RepID=A0A1H2WQA2_9BACL|nr:peptidase M42 [Alicyclobacillus hesperidum]GLV12605.1 aminopeptidase [Alicyclobacillus hesperidum]SDW82688.1 endoglucanase [Alicyclobacillus hesperidum]